MLSFGGQRIFLVVAPTDMRKSFNGLTGLASALLGATPESRDLFVFANRARNRLKILLFDESGAWVLAKRLDKGTFAWPTAEQAASASSVEYRAEELSLLLGGLDAGDLAARNWRRRSPIAVEPQARA